MVWLPYDILVELAMLVIAPSAILVLYVFLYLRIRSPNLERPFKIAGGLPAAIITVLPAFGLTSAMAYFTMVDDEPYFGVDYFKLVGFAVVVGFGLLCHLVWWWWWGRHVADELEHVPLLEENRHGIVIEESGDTSI